MGMMAWAGDGFLDPGYLRHGNQRQRAAFAVLDELGLFKRLAAHGPVLAGTVPLAIDIAGSDLDILCQAADLDGLAGDAYAALPSLEAWSDDELRRLLDDLAETHGG